MFRTFLIHKIIDESIRIHFICLIDNMQEKKLDDFEEGDILPFNIKLKVSEESIRKSWDAIQVAIEKLEEDSDSL
jgi:hypothetical protein